MSGQPHPGYPEVPTTAPPPRGYPVRMPKRVTHRSKIERRSRSAGLAIAQLHREHLPSHLNPYLAFDHFAMAQPFFPPHPHAGFSAVTYMFPQSRGGFVNRDTSGAPPIDIHPGDLHWTGAGRGIVHEEVPRERGVTCDGLQIFVDLPAGSKWMEPVVLHLSSADVPRVTTAGAEVRVVVGRHGEVASPLTPLTEVTLLDVVLDAGATFRHTVPAGEDRFVYVIEGDAQIGGDGSSPLGPLEAAGVSRDGDELVVTSKQGAHFVVGGGRPLDQDVVYGGPIVMTTEADVTRAARAYQRGEMGRLDPSF